MLKPKPEVFRLSFNPFFLEAAMGSATLTRKLLRSPIGVIALRPKAFVEIPWSLPNHRLNREQKMAQSCGEFDVNSNTKR